MKHFLKLFILVELLLFSYIFITSVYNIYEKNHIVNKNMIQYAIQENDPELNGVFFDRLSANINNHKIIIVSNKVTDTKKSVYELYCMPYDDFNRKQPVSSSMEYDYKSLTKEDFIDSTGIFYTDIPDYQIRSLAAESNLTLKFVSNNTISYSVFIKLYAVDFLILIAVIQIIYCIYTSYNLKKIGIKKSMGFSIEKIQKEQIKDIFKWLAFFSLAIISSLSIYLLIKNRFSFSFLNFIVIYYLLIGFVNILCVFNTSFIISLVSLESMVKKQSVNQAMNTVAQIIKLIFTILISITIILVINNAESYKDSNQKVLDYKMLDNYYTGNGFYSSVYDKALNHPETLKKYSDNIKQLYSENECLLCDTSSLDLKNIDGIEEQLHEYELNKIIINKNYYNKFAEVTASGERITVSDNTYTALISKKYINIKDEISDFLLLEFQTLSIYDEFNGLESNNEENPYFDIIYVDESSTIKCNTENGFEDIEVNVVLIDNNNSGSTYYLDSINSRKIFLELESREQFSALLIHYNLDDLISSGTLLTPFYAQMENVQFVLKTLIVFSVVFVFSLLFIIYISDYIDIIVNKSRFALKETLGFSHLKISSSKYIFLLIELIIIIVLSIVNRAIICAAIAVIIDFIIFELIYRMFIKHKINDIIKGA